MDEFVNENGLSLKDLISKIPGLTYETGYKQFQNLLSFMDCDKKELINSKGEYIIPHQSVKMFADFSTHYHVLSHAAKGKKTKPEDWISYLEDLRNDPEIIDLMAENDDAVPLLFAMEPLVSKMLEWQELYQRVDIF